MDQPQFETRAQRRARLREERKQPQPQRNWGRWMWVIIVILVIGGGVWWFTSRPKITSAEQAAKDAKRVHDLALSCTTDAATTFHIHSHLSITMNGQDRPIPADTGVTADCLHPLHTHDATSIIHIESPRKEDFTLGDFMDVWKEDLTSNKVLDTTVDAQHQMKMFVDGKEVTTGRDTIFRDRQSIAIIVAPKDQTITPPANYDFPANL